MNLFLTGTDTDAGKTYVAAMLIRALRRAGLDSVGFKPICCGGREDAEILQSAGDGAASLNQVNPVWLRTPAAPYTAAMIENRAIDLDLIRGVFAALRLAHPSVIVEGVGGWRVPIACGYFVSDLARELALPVAVVVPNRLGAINHALLTIEAIRGAGLDCAGVILNHLTPATSEPSIAVTTNREIIEDLAGVPVLFEIACGQQDLTLALA